MPYIYIYIYSLPYIFCMSLCFILWAKILSFDGVDPQLSGRHCGVSSAVLQRWTVGNSDVGKIRIKPSRWMRKDAGFNIFWCLPLSWISFWVKVIRINISSLTRTNWCLLDRPRLVYLSRTATSTPEIHGWIQLLAKAAWHKTPWRTSN